MEFYDSILRTLAALAVVLGLMVALAWAFRRFGTSPLFGVGQTPLIRIVATASLGPRKAVSLVSIGDEWLVVGTGANEVVSLGRVSHPEGFPGNTHKQGATRGSTTFMPVPRCVDVAHD
ncbi:hypothetical protein YTPLAS18_27300 [Nitrospira sp.]|nr:hypothetical protein YTPLAS18_27300 [Nitrospira sp.]